MESKLYVPTGETTLDNHIVAALYDWDNHNVFPEEAQDHVAEMLDDNIFVVGTTIELSSPDGPVYVNKGEYIALINDDIVLFDKADFESRYQPY